MDVAAARELARELGRDADMRANAAASPNTRIGWFHQTLWNGRANLMVIAEVKRRSPALGGAGSAGTYGAYGRGGPEGTLREHDPLREMVALVERLGMTAFVEAHELAAFGRAVACGGKVVGVNARNLRRPTEIDVGRVRQLHTFVHADQVLVAESGISSVDDAPTLPARVDASPADPARSP